MKYQHHSFAAVLVSFILSIGFATALAEEVASDPPGVASGKGAGLDPTVKTALTPEFLETKIKETEAVSDLEETTKTKLLELYRKALSELQAASALEAKATAYKKALETAPDQARAIRDKLAEAAEARAEPEALPNEMSVSEIEQLLAKTEADAAAVGAKLSEIEKDLEGNASRPAAARKAIADAKQALDALETASALPSPQGEAQELANARRWNLEARRQSLRSEILMLDQELLSQGVRIDLLKASRDKAVSDLGLLKAAAQTLQERLARQLKGEAADAAAQTRETQRQAADKHPLIRDLAESNAALSDELTALTEGLDRVAGAQEQIETQTRHVEEDFRSARQRVEAAGLTRALGQALIDQRNRLPNLRTYRKAAVERERATTETTLSQIRYSEEQRRLQDTDAYVQALMPDEITAEERAEVTPELQTLVKQRRTLLEQVLQTAASYLRVLGDLDYASSRLIQAADEYDGFLDERLLWVRSTQPVGLATFRSLPRAVFWAIDPGNWLEVAGLLLHELTRSPTFWVLLLIAGLLQWKTPAMRRGIRDTAAPLRRIRTDDIRYTLEALGLTLMTAAPLPLLLATLGLQLYASLEATDFTKAIGQAAISVSLGVYFLLSFRFLCIRGGVADQHFRWNGDVLRLLRLHFDWLLAMLVPLGFVATAAYNHPDETYSGSLGRLSLLALTLGFAVFFARVLSPERGALRNLIAERPEGWFSRTRKLWYPLVVAMPLALAVLTAVGYVYTVGTLMASLVSSMYLVLGIAVLHQLIVRWLVLTRRKLALHAVLERRPARAAEQADRSRESGAAQPEMEEPNEVDFASLDGQTRRLVNMLLFIGGAVALWAIWSEVLPAFGIFEEVALWHHTGVVDGEERIVPFTLADVGMVLVISFVAVVAAKNLPALFEILLLSHTSMSAGSRYAVTTMTGYIIAAAAALDGLQRTGALLG